MGRFNKNAQDKVRQRRSRENDKHRSHVPTMDEKNAEANRRASTRWVGPFEVTTHDIGSSCFKRSVTNESRQLGRKPTTVRLDAAKLSAINHFDILNPKTKSIVVHVKISGVNPFPFSCLLSDEEADDVDGLWQTFYNKLPVDGGGKTD